MALIFSIGVHSSISTRKDANYFYYKDIQFKYMPLFGEHYADCLIGRFKSGHVIDDCYSLMTEFLSAIAFGHDAQIIPEPGMSTRVNCSLVDYTGGFRVSRRIRVQEFIDQIWMVPAIRTDHQNFLSRLYREARSSNNIYHSILFYWHTIVYPSKSDKKAVIFIDKLWKDPPQHLLYLKDEVERILKNPMFMPSFKEIGSLGEYFREGIRNSIAHIVRDNRESLPLQYCRFDSCLSRWWRQGQSP